MELAVMCIAYVIFDNNNRHAFPLTTHLSDNSPFPVLGSFYP